MAGPDFKQATALIASDDLLFRKRLVNALRAASFSIVEECADPGAVDTALTSTDFDLLLVTARLQGQSLTPLLHAIRDGSHRHHPFPIVIIIMAETDKNIIANIANCGPDDVVLFPVEPPQLLSRIAGHVQSRKPFVVTGDFVGPDRRKEVRPGDTAPRLDCPNPLMARIIKATDAARDSEITTARLALNAIKIERTVFELGWLNRAISRLLGEQPVDINKIDTYIARLVEIAEALPPRVPPSVAAAISTATQAFALAVGAMRGGHCDSERLAALSAGLLQAIHANTGKSGSGGPAKPATESP